MGRQKVNTLRQEGNQFIIRGAKANSRDGLGLEEATGEAPLVEAAAPGDAGRLEIARGSSLGVLVPAERGERSGLRRS